MCSAGILDCLGREPDVLVWVRGADCVEVKFAVEGFVFGGFFVGWVFKEEDYANGGELLEGFGVEGDEFFKLDILDAEGFDEEREDAGGVKLVSWSVLSRVGVFVTDSQLYD